MVVTTCAVPVCDTRILSPKRICSECTGKLPEPLREDLRALTAGCTIGGHAYEEAVRTAVAHLSRWGATV